MVKDILKELLTKSLHLNSHTIQCRICVQNQKVTTLQDSIVHFASEMVNSISTQSLFQCAFYVGSAFFRKGFFVPFSLVVVY